MGARERDECKGIKSTGHRIVPVIYHVWGLGLGGKKRALEEAAGLRAKRCTQGLDTCLRSRRKYIGNESAKEFEGLGM